MLKRLVLWLLNHAEVLPCQKEVEPETAPVVDRVTRVSTIPPGALLDIDGSMMIGCDDAELMNQQIAGRRPGITFKDWWVEGSEDEEHRLLRL